MDAVRDTYAQLRNALAEFKTLLAPSVAESIAEWTEVLDFYHVSWKTNALPFTNERGVYAFVAPSGAVYIGRASGPTSSFGMRVWQHFCKRAANVIIDGDRLRFTDAEAWLSTATHLTVVVFPAAYCVLAGALEEWLISKLQPTANKVGR